MIRVAVTLALLVAVLAAPAAAQRSARPQVRWGPRLESLTPTAPMDYFELAEEVADAAKGQADLSLARHLFGLAGALDPGRLGRSACLALADLARDEHVRRRYLALATLLDRRGGAGGWSGREEAEIDRTAALALAEALSHYRNGNGDKALTSLRSPGAMDLLRGHGPALRGGVDRFLADCQLYKGQSRPFVSDQDLVVMLRLEVALLAGRERTWADELLLTGGRPLVEVDPGRLEETFGVDASRPYFVDGEWRGR
jgi:hypothetical protein